jgi:hypothetical protein
MVYNWEFQDPFASWNNRRSSLLTLARARRMREHTGQIYEQCGSAEFLRN